MKLCRLQSMAVLAACGCMSALAQKPVDFEADVRPVLQRSCQGCHGPDRQMGQLRLDVKSAAILGGQSGKVIIPADAEASILYQRVAGIGDQPRMPMGGKLKPEEIETIRRWISEGASWPDAGVTAAASKKHWAFIAPVKPSLPPVLHPEWCANPIDRFVLARLDAEGIQPSKEADRITLLRRLSLDLTGLPPTPEEVDSFLSDRSKTAYEKQVDRLLNSPHYGEKWGRTWLDAARYADSDGYEKDKARQVWFYRDWVIRALNNDLPWNQFIIRQIAGDLLPNPTQDDIVATGFLRNSMVNEEGGVDPEQFRMEAMFDRVETVSKSILGLTVQCAQCHNHKFDPVRQEEYYRMLAFMNDSDEATVAVFTPDEMRKKEAILREVQAIENRIKADGSWKRAMASWEASVQNPQPEWTTLTFDAGDLMAGGQKLIPQADGSLLAQGDSGTNITQELTSKVSLAMITAVRLELFTDPNLPRNGPGRGPAGTCALSEISLEAAAQGGSAFTAFPFVRATSDIALPEAPLAAMFESSVRGKRTTGPASFAIDGKQETAWGIDAGAALRNLDRKAVFVLAQPVSFSGGATLKIKLAQNHGGGTNNTNNLGRFRLSVTSAPDAQADPVPRRVREALKVASAERTAAQTSAIFDYWRTTVPRWNPESQRIAELLKDYPEGGSQLVLQHQEHPRETHLLVRGDYTKPGRTVKPGVPASLHALNPGGESESRLDFANWLVDRNSPTTARAFVNRVWQSYFGTGIVATSEDFGTQADIPSHPELLDWLAVDFMDRGWSAKSLHRLIVTSATYRQSSEITADALQKDPQNRLMARGPRFRVEAETIRDIALAASGLLSSAVGGPSVYPPAPEFLFRRPVSFANKDWFTSTGPDRYRRALYTFRYRSVPYPMLQTFDAPSGEVSCVRRSRSNTPLQALTMLNEPLFIEAAQALAKRTVEQGGETDGQRMRFAFRRCVSRMPRDPELAELLALLAKEKQRFSESGREPATFAGVDKETAAAPSVEAAAWTAVARVLLNLDETITKE